MPTDVTALPPDSTAQAQSWDKQTSFVRGDDVAQAKGQVCPSFGLAATIAVVGECNSTSQRVHCVQTGALCATRRRHVLPTAYS